MKKKPTKVPKFKRLPHFYKVCIEFAFKLTNEFHTIFHPSHFNVPIFIANKKTNQ